MWYKENFFKYTVAAILVLLIVLLLYQVSPIFSPLIHFLTALLLPIILAGLLYYLLRPLVHFVESRGVSRFFAILIVYLLIVVLFIILNTIFLPNIIEQFQEFSPTEKFAEVQEKTIDIMHTLNFKYFKFEDFQRVLSNYYTRVSDTLNQFVLNTISIIANLALALILTPFILFYFLKDDYLFAPHFLKYYIPHDYHAEAQKILEDIDKTLSGFITAQLIIAVLFGFLLFLGYSLIGLNHALLLSMLAMLFYTIPFLGTILAITPALIVALTHSIFMALKVITVMVVVLLFESNVASPWIMGHQLRIHPLTIIFLLIAAGSAYGLVGLLLATPTYAILKVLISNFYKIFKLRYRKKEQDTTLLHK